MKCHWNLHGALLGLNTYKCAQISKGQCYSTYKLKATLYLQTLNPKLFLKTGFEKMDSSLSLGHVE